MKKMSLKPTKNEKPVQRCESITGNACHQRGCATSVAGWRRRIRVIGQHRMMRHHQQGDEGAEISDGEVVAARAARAVECARQLRLAGRRGRD